MRVSLLKRVWAMAVVAGGALALFATPVPAQIESVRIEVLPQSRSVRIEVDGVPQKNWSFRDTYAGVIGLASRIRNFQAVDTPGARNSVRILAPGHFELGATASRVSYEVDLSAPPRASEAAFVSWLSGARGILHLNDLLPIMTRRPGGARQPVFTTVEAPDGWSAQVNEQAGATRARGFAPPDDGVIFVGKNLRRAGRTNSGSHFDLLIDGAWTFSDQEALDTLLKVVQLHSEIGALRCAQVTLVLSTFPSGTAAANTWSAETRGCNITLLMGQDPSRVGALAQLGNALSHEAFHLWIPNGLALTGDYDWFYEGFTMYQAARAAMRLGLISWPEFLNAIARAHDGSNTAAPKLSLIDASRQRWTGGASAVYSKAMVVAFLYDLSLRSQTGGKRSLDDVYRRILREHSIGSAIKRVGMDGNEAALTALTAELTSGDFLNRFVSTPASLDLHKELAPFGLRVEKLVRTHISVSDKLTKRQRDLLKQLGYNEPRQRGQNRLQ